MDDRHRNISIYYQNVRGIRTKLHTLFINILSFSFDVIILSETWLTPNILDSEFIDDRYVVFRDDRNRIATNKRDGGGVLIAVLRELRPRRMLTGSIPNGFEHVMVELPASRPHSRHVISAVYMPPRSEDDVYMTHFDMLQDIMMDPSTDSFYIVGDYNLPDINWLECPPAYQSTNVASRYLVNLLSFTNASQYNNILNNKGRILDIFISNTDCQVQHGAALLSPDMHHPPFSVISSLEVHYKPMKRNFVVRHMYNKANYEDINTDLAKIDWDDSLTHLPSEQAVDTFYNIIHRLVRKHVPYTHPKTTRFPIWFNVRLIKIFKNKERSWAKWKKFHNLSDYESFTYHRKSFKTQCMKCYNDYIKRVEDTIPINVKHFWTYITSRKGKVGYPANMHYKDCISSSPRDTCNLFSTYFSSVYESSTFNSSIWLPPVDYAVHSECLSHINLDRNSIHKALKDLDVTKGPGPDGLPPIFLKQTAKDICTPLHILFNKCLLEGIFPGVWKRAYITPIYKSGDRTNIENYRPISILSTMSKVFESLVRSSIFPLIRHLISTAQHGFIPSRSTTTNLIVFTDYLFENMDNRVQVDAVYTDFRKAFDRVDHKILLDKLAFNGIRGNLLRWFTSYITKRTQTVIINGFKSVDIVPESGVPQGSILGPLLFLIFINDVEACFMNSRFLMYADDIKVYRACRSVQDCTLLQEDLDRLSQYCIHNKLPLNLSKCNSMVFTKNRNIISYPYSLNGVPLCKVERVRDLGLLLDSKLHLDTHIDNIIGHAYKMYGFVMRSSNDFKKPSTFLYLYMTLIRSQLEYAVPIWSPYYCKYTNSLEIVQKKFLRSVHYKCFGYKIPYHDLLTKFKLLSLESRRLLLKAMTLYGICTNKYDCTYLTNKLCYAVPRTIVRREVRTSYLFYTTKCRTNAGKRAPLRRLVETYNTHFASIDIFENSPQSFKKLVNAVLAGGS